MPVSATHPPGGVSFPLFPSSGPETDGHFGSEERSDVKRPSDAVVGQGVSIAPHPGALCLWDGDAAPPPFCE